MTTDAEHYPADTGFYRHLPAVAEFDDLLTLEPYQPVPDDWYVLVADVVDSTGAIRNNRYQDVNTLGASCIIAVLNACDSLCAQDYQTSGIPTQASRASIPYVFGGDGASFCVPPTCRDAALTALKGSQKISDQAYNLTLRTGCVPVKALRTAGHDLLLAKLSVSDHAWQAAFAGSGMTEAERWIKKEPERFAIPDDLSAEADFTGLQCRWDRIPSPSDETLSLLIESRCQTLEQQSTLYQQALSKIQAIYGDRHLHHPLQPDRMKMTLSAKKLRSEVRLFATGKHWFYRLGYHLKVRLIALLGSMMMASNMTVSGYNWGGYKADMVHHSDHRKFDNMLRMVLAGTSEQRRQLTQWLEQQYQAGTLYYGISRSEAALLTCLVFQHGNDHFHFVDGADGGYTLAASQLKQQKQAEA